MKGASIISIFIALVLIVGGFILCAQARAKAPSDAAIDGNTLVNEDGNVVTEILLTGQTFTIVNIDVEDCKVEIHGNAETSSVTLINFNENTYVAASGEKTLTVSNKISILDYLNLDGSGVKFSGVWKTLRSFLNFDTSKGEREIHVYIGRDADVSKVNIACDSGSNLRVTDIDKNCDISFSTNDSNLEISNINAAAMIISGSNSNITLGNTKVTSLEYSASATNFNVNGLTSENATIDTKSSNISLLNSDFRNMTVTLESGDFLLSTKYDRLSYFRKIAITEGEILLNGNPIGQKDESAEELLESSLGTMTITVNSGKIDLAFGTEVLPPIEDQSTETTTK